MSTDVPAKTKQQLGGEAVHKKYGSVYMSRLGKRGRKKQLRELKSARVLRG